MATSRRNSHVSMQQLETIWDFLNINRDIATAYNRSLIAKKYAMTKWTELANILNSQDGTRKDWKGWSKYWVDYKSKLKAKVASLRSSQVRTGGRPSTEELLFKMEIKFLQILGEDFRKGLPGVIVEPIPEPQRTSAISINTDVQDSLVTKSVHQIHKAPNLSAHIQTPHSEDASEALPQASRLSRPSDTIPNQSIEPYPKPQVQGPTYSQRCRRHRYKPSMKIHAAIRARLKSSQMRAKTAVLAAKSAERTAELLEQVAEEITEIRIAFKRIVRILTAAFPTVTGRENSS